MIDGEDREDDVLELDTELDEQDDSPEEAQQPETDAGADDAGEDEEELIGFEGDDEEPAPETSTMRHLREQLNAEKKRRIEAEAKVPKLELGEKPTLEDFDYDGDKFADAILAWNQRKADIEKQASAATTANEAGREAFNAKLADYATQKTKLARADFEDVESVVTSRLSEIQQSALISVGGKNKAALVYALGRSPARLDAIAAITDPFELGAAVANLERSLKVQARKKAPEPQGRLKGGTPSNESGDKKRERLLADARRTGDRTALIAYDRKQREKA